MVKSLHKTHLSSHPTYNINNKSNTNKQQIHQIYTCRGVNKENIPHTSTTRAQQQQLLYSISFTLRVSTHKQREGLRLLLIFGAFDDFCIISIVYFSFSFTITCNQTSKPSRLYTYDIYSNLKPQNYNKKKTCNDFSSLQNSQYYCWEWF